VRIALAVRVFSREWGGMERVSAMLAKALKEAGHEVVVFAERADEEGFPVRAVPTAGFVSPLRLLSFHRNLRRMLSAERFDVVLGFSPFFPLDVYRAGGGVHAHWMRLRCPNPFLRSLKYIFSPVHLAMRYLERNIMKDGNHRLIIANSELVKRHIVDYFGVDEKRVGVVYNGVDFSVFNAGVKKHGREVREEFGIEKDALVGLFASNNWERKGLTTVIRALCGVSGLKIIVAGRGRKRKFLHLMDSLGAGRSSVVFAGARRDMERLYGAADFFVLPTRYDPCSNACLEAMACGLPVITTMENGASEFLKDGASGFILHNWDAVDGLREFFLRLKDKSVRSRMAESALSAIEPFTVERCAARIAGICAEAADRK
jgi:UDP-glucose:(heptosyl)LPS alpha-1,3-glucosyltransferase